MMAGLAASTVTTVSAHEVATNARLPLPTVSKLLSALARAGLLVAVRGAKGGYRLSRPAEQITIADIVAAVDGPIALTQCLEHGPGYCEMEGICPSQRGLRVINDAVSRAFAAVTLADLAAPPVAVSLRPAASAADGCTRAPVATTAAPLE